LKSEEEFRWVMRWIVCCGVLQVVAVCCSVLQCVAVCFPCVAVCCIVLQCVAVWCSVGSRHLKNNFVEL